MGIKAIIKAVIKAFSKKSSRKVVDRLDINSLKNTQQKENIKIANETKRK